MALMKHGLGEAAICRIVNAIGDVEPLFDGKLFTKMALKGLDELELKQRVSHIIHCLHCCLNKDFAAMSQLLVAIVPIWQRHQTSEPNAGFAAWPLIDYVAQYGLDEPQIALETLKQLTSLFSAEFAIRPFIVRYPDICHRYFLSWVHDDCEHVRRLVSEGTRPRLPWGLRLTEFVVDPTPNLVLLSVLNNDSSVYVRRSVANHLNDIAKDHPNVVLKICYQWQANASPYTQWIIKHATRSLVKQGHPEVFNLLGYNQNLALMPVQLLIAQQQLEMGQALEFEFALCLMGQTEQACVVDFAIDFVKSNGKTNNKVFKLKNIRLRPREALHFKKSFSFKKISTRQYYAGLHQLSILVNGNKVASQTFMLQAP